MSWRMMPAALAPLLLGTLGRSGRLRETAAGVGGLCDGGVVQRSGYYELHEPGKTNDHYFYWMFESRSKPATDPFILWLTGGPGCSGMLALLNENGPCSVVKDGGALHTVDNPYSWTSNATVLWIDQPTGVGFSYGDAGDYDHDELGVRQDVYTFLIEFFTAHPEYASLPLYIFGESYGGHYAPNVAYAILKGNEKSIGLKLNLQGMAVGNGLTDPALQYPYYPQMANNNTYGIKTVSESAYASMVSQMPSCISAIQECQYDTAACAPARSLCNDQQLAPYEEAGLNPYDVRLKCAVRPLCYDFSAPTDWLDLPSTRVALGVTKASSKWSSCNMRVNTQFAADWMKSQEYTVPPLLAAGVRVLIYAGDADFVCNWMGNKAWVTELSWPGKAAFGAAPDLDWVVDGAKAGKLRRASGLSFLQVFGAGHMVPMDQPVNALAMVNEFIHT